MIVRGSEHFVRLNIFLFWRCSLRERKTGFVSFRNSGRHENISRRAVELAWIFFFGQKFQIVYRREPPKSPWHRSQIKASNFKQLDLKNGMGEQSGFLKPRLDTGHAWRREQWNKKRASQRERESAVQQKLVWRSTTQFFSCEDFFLLMFFNVLVFVHAWHTMILRKQSIHRSNKLLAKLKADEQKKATGRNRIRPFFIREVFTANLG